jgi:MFS family permease
LLDGSHYDLVWMAAGASALVASLVAVTTKETRVVHEHAERGKLIAPAAVRPGIILAATLIGITGFSVFLPLYGPEIGVDDVGLVFLVYGIVVLGVRIIGAKLPDILGPVLAASIAIGSTAAGLAIAALWHSTVGLFVAALVIAVGSSFLYPAALLLSLRGVPEYQRASVVGTLSAFFDFAGGASGIVLGVVAAVSSYQGAFGVSAVLAAFALVLLRTGFAGHAEGDVPTVAEVAPATAEPTTLP